MKFKSIVLSSFAASTLLIASCGNGDNANNTVANNDSTTVTTAENPITLAEVTDSKEFNDATLAIKEIKAEPAGNDSVKVTINYNVGNYTLGAQTEAGVSSKCNNSDKGQHIHFILDQTPYTALYEPTHSFTVAKNSEHYVMSFLSRSYHESVKSKTANVLVKFKIDEAGKLVKLDNPTTPMVFYSRPKGDYVGKDTENLLLDFYLVNTDLTDGNQVKVNINGQEYLINNWAPKFIQHAPMGTLNVNLQLVDKDGNALTGDNTTASREIKLAQQEPLNN